MRLGEYDEGKEQDCNEYKNCADPVQDIEPLHFIAHSEYDRNTFVNDIGLVRLKDAARMTQNNIKPICLPFEPDAKKLVKNGVKFVVIGKC